MFKAKVRMFLSANVTFKRIKLPQLLMFLNVYDCFGLFFFKTSLTSSEGECFNCHNLTCLKQPAPYF